MIEVKNLTKKYGSKTAVDNISFTVKPGEILGFLGPNGAGKTTTMNIITGYISATEGTVSVDGHEIFEDPIAVKSQIGYLPEHPPLYLDMTVKEYLGFMFDLKKVKLPRKDHIEEICELVGITHVYHRIIGNLSKGYRQRVGLAQALLGNPQVLIMDEPTVGLDPNQIIEIRNLIKSLGDKHTIILSSHILPEVQAICERVIVINQGKLIADDTPDHLARSMSTDHKLSVRIDGPEEQVYSLLKNLPGMETVQKLGVREDTAFEYSLESEPGADVRRAMFSRLADRNWPILELRSSELSLEDIFLRLTSGDSIQLHDHEELGELLEDTAPTEEALSESQETTEKIAEETVPEPELTDKGTDTTENNATDKGGDKQ